MKAPYVTINNNVDAQNLNLARPAATSLSLQGPIQVPGDMSIHPGRFLTVTGVHSGPIAAHSRVVPGAAQPEGTILSDGLDIVGGTPLTGTDVQSQSAHRIAISLAIAVLNATGTSAARHK